MNAIERIERDRVVAVLRRVPDPTAVVQALLAGGIGVVEITLDSENALSTIEELRSRGDVTVLAGTVRTVDEVEAATAAGAEACVEPVFSGAVVARCHQLGVPVIPGALTPTEVEAAWRAGAAMVKLFPGSLGGPGYVRDLRGPLPDVPLLVTGGVGADNAVEFLRAGATAIGIGSALTAASDVERVARAVAAAARAA